MADAKAQELKDHARGAIDNYSSAKKRQNNQFNTTSIASEKFTKGNKTYDQQHMRQDMKGGDANHYRTDKYSNDIVIGDPKKVMVSNYCEDQPDGDGSFSPMELKFDTKRVSMPNKLESTDEFADSFAANDRCEDTMKSKAEGTFMANDRCDDTMRSKAESTFMANDRFDYSNASGSNKSDTFVLSETGKSRFNAPDPAQSEVFDLTVADPIAGTITKPIVQKAVSYDDRKIVSSGKYDYEEYYYNYEMYQSDEFESEEDTIILDSDKVEASKDHEELTSIIDNYK